MSQNRTPRSGGGGGRPAGATARRRQAAKRRNAIVAVVAVVALALVAGLILLSQRSGDDGGASADDVAAADVAKAEEVKALLAGIPQSGYTLGSPDAPVTIVEYGDLRCPVCKAWEEEHLATVVDDLVKSGRAKLEFVPWPVTGPPEDAEAAAQAAHAAAAQNAVWTYGTLFYRNQQDEREAYATPAFVDGIAQAAGLDLARFRADREDPTVWATQIQDANVQASTDGLTGTPSFIVEGPGGQREILPSIPTAEELTAIVDRMAGGAAPTTTGG